MSGIRGFLPVSWKRRSSTMHFRVTKARNENLRRLVVAAALLAAMVTTARASPDDREFQKNAAMAVVYYNVGKDRCDLTAEEDRKLKQMATMIIENRFGLTWNDIKSEWVEYFLEDHPAFEDAIKNNPRAVKIVCKAIRDLIN
jgi:hypothetical protein